MPTSWLKKQKQKDSDILGAFLGPLMRPSPLMAKRNPIKGQCMHMWNASPSMSSRETIERLGESFATRDSSNPRHSLGSRLGRREMTTGGTSPMQDSARAESGARADWQACTTHAFLLDHRTSCTVFRAIVVFAMTAIARSFTTHLTSFAIHRVRFGPDSRESGPNPGTGLT